MICKTAVSKGWCKESRLSHLPNDLVIREQQNTFWFCSSFVNFGINIFNVKYSNLFL